MRRRARFFMGTTTERDCVDRRAVFFFFAVRLARVLVLRFLVAEAFLAVRRAVFFFVFLRAAVFFLREPAAFFLAVRLAAFFFVVFFLAADARFLVRRAAGFFFLVLDAVVRFLAVLLVAFFLVGLAAVPAFLRVLRRAAVPTFFLVVRFLAAVRTDDFERVVRDFLRRTFAKVTSPYGLH